MGYNIATNFLCYGRSLSNADNGKKRIGGVKSSKKNIDFRISSKRSKKGNKFNSGRPLDKRNGFGKNHSQNLYQNTTKPKVRRSERRQLAPVSVSEDASKEEMETKIVRSQKFVDFNFNDLVKSELSDRQCVIFYNTGRPPDKLISLVEKKINYKNINEQTMTRIVRRLHKEVQKIVRSRVAKTRSQERAKARRMKRTRPV